MNRLREKAHAALSTATHDPRSDGALWNIKIDDQDDELDIFAGRTRLVSSKRPSPSPISSASGDYRPVQGYTPSPPSVHAPPVAASTSVYSSRPQSAIYPPTLPALPPLRVPETPASGSSSAKWIQPPSVSMSSHGYPPDAYPPPQQRHDPYYPPSSSYPQQAPIHQQHQQSIPYNWASETSQPVSRINRQYPSMQTLPPHSQPSQPPSQHQQAQYAAEMIPQAHYSPPAENYIAQQQHGRTLHPVSAHAGTPSPSSYLPPPPELVNLGLAARDSRLEERWTTFMHETGFLDSMSGSNGHPPNPY